MAFEAFAFWFVYRRLDELFRKMTYSIEEYLYNASKSSEYPDYLMSAKTYNHDEDDNYNEY